MFSAKGLVLLFLIGVAASSYHDYRAHGTQFPRHRVLPAKIDQENKGNDVYVVDVLLGKPFRPYRLRVSFSHAGIVLFRDISRLSSTYSFDYTGSDILKIGTGHYRIPVAMSADTTDKGCLDCDGILGLEMGSVIWRIWPHISFSRATVYLGKQNPVIDEISDKQTIRCEDPQISGSLCKSRGQLHIPEIGISTETAIDINPTVENIELPAKIYDAYMKGRNIYTDDLSKWPKLRVEIPALENKTFQFVISPEHHFASSLNAPRHVAIVRSEGESLSIGTYILRQKIIHKNGLDTTLLLASSSSVDALSLANLFILLFLVVLYSRWRITDLRKPVSSDYDVRNSMFNLFFETAGVGLTIAAYVIPSSLNVLESHIIIYVMTGVILGVSIFFKAVAVVRSFTFSQIKVSEYESILENSLVRSLTHEIILLTGMWLVLLERRVEYASTALVLFINVYLVYITLYYFFVMLSYIFYQKTRVSTDFVAFTFFVFLVFLVIVYQVLVAVNFFIRPLFVRNYSIYEELLVPALALFYMLLAAIAVYVVQLYVKKSGRVVLTTEKK